MSLISDRLDGIQAGVAIKAPCRVSTTANITLSGEQTIDGVAVSANGSGTAPDRVLVKNQTNTVENGIYDVSTSAWTRAKDFDGARDVVQGTLVPVYAGTANGRTTWQCTTANPVRPGTSNLAFEVVDDVDLAADLAEVDSPLGATIVGYKRALVGAIETNVREFLDGSEIYLQRDFGCTADGVADDTSKIEAAIAAATNGDVIVFERGTYLISSLAQITKRLTFRGWNFGAVIIKTTSATATIFDVNGFFACFENLWFQSSVARTGGSYIWFNTSGSHCRVENVYMQNYISGIRVTAAAGVSLNRILMDNPAAGADAILFDGGNEHFLNQVEIGGDGVGNSGIRITNTGSLQFTDVNVIRHGADLLVNPETGQEVDNVYISNSFFDTADYGVLILPSGSGHVQNIRFNGCWTCSHSFQGVLISNVVGWTGRITGLTFVDHNSQGNAQEGLYIGAGIACKVVAGKFLGNTNSGIYVAANVDDFHILGARCGDETGTYAGNGRYGIEIAAGTSDHYTIQAGCDLRGNTLGALLNGASGTDRIIGHNLGHVTQAKGQASITAAATTVVVNHGLSGTPDLQDIRLVPLTSLGTSVTYWVSTNTSTQFTINVNTAPGVTISWGWEARITGD